MGRLEEVNRQFLPQKQGGARIHREGLISEHFGSAPFIGIWDIRVSGSVTLSREKEVFGPLGPSGAGKTARIKMLSGILKYRME